MPLHREELDAALAQGCQVPGCDHAHGPINELWLHQKCHPSEHTAVCYREGNLHLFCALCRQPLATIAVARRS